jgi:hypothetical protein
MDDSTSLIEVIRTVDGAFVHVKDHLTQPAQGRYLWRNHAKLDRMHALGRLFTLDSYISRREYSSCQPRRLAPS